MNPALACRQDETEAAWWGRLTPIDRHPGDVTGDGSDDLVSGGGPGVSVWAADVGHDRVFRPSVALDFSAADEAFRGGVPVG